MGRSTTLQPKGNEADFQLAVRGQGQSARNPLPLPRHTRDTALAEVRPWIGATISVARFRIRRELNVIDCSKHHSIEKVFGLIGDKTHGREEDGIWTAIDQAFATPVTRDDEGGEYIPTQIIAEMFKCEGFDGIVYSVLSEDGFNLVLFNLNDADVVNCALYKAEYINFDFQPVVGSEYFVHDEVEAGKETA